MDVGCFHPIRQNNTYLMHQLGWKGVNIDLNPLSIELFNIARPNDINICAAVSNKKSTTILYFDHSLSSLNTISKKHIFFLKKAFGLNKLKKKKIKTYTLTSLLKKNKIRKIDFMNIDIEDSELKVLKTLNFNYFDIKVICIEVLNQFVTKQNKINKISIYYFKKYARVYLEDTDAGGIVYHTSYLKFAERARSDMLRKMKLEHTKLRNIHGIQFVVQKMLIEYKSFATLEQLLTVKSYITSVSAAKIVMKQIISLKTNILVKIDIVLGSVNFNGQPTRLPTRILNTLNDNIHQKEIEFGN